MSKFTDRIDMRFLYTPSSATDIRKTFNRVRREIKEREEQAKKMATVTKMRTAK